jgi:ubiquitin-like modifier-activating enzyme 5
VNRARELTGELRKLQDQVESLDSARLQENVQKVRTLQAFQHLVGACLYPAASICSMLSHFCSQLHEHVARITDKLHATLASLNALPPATPGGGGGGGGSSLMSPQLSVGAPTLAAPRARIDKMSAEVVDSNPYSRLMALQRMGIVDNYESIREKTVRRLERVSLSSTS